MGRDPKNRTQPLDIKPKKEYKKATGATRRQFCNSSIAMNSKQQLTK